MFKFSTKQLAEAGIFVGISVVLDLVSGFFGLRLWAQGGSINLALLPIIFFSLRNGAGLGIMVGIAARSLAMLFAPYGIYHPLSAVLDYILIGAFIGMTGVFRGFKGEFGTYLGIVIFGALALFSYTLSGVILFAAYMPDVFLGLPMTNMWVYSALYNATHFVPSLIISVIVLVFIPKKLRNL